MIITMLFKGETSLLLKGAFSKQYLDPNLKTWFLGSTSVNNPNGILIVSAVFSGQKAMTKRQAHGEMDK